MSKTAELLPGEPFQGRQTRRLRSNGSLRFESNLHVCACIYAKAQCNMGKQYTVRQQCMVKGTWHLHCSSNPDPPNFGHITPRWRCIFQVSSPAGCDVTQVRWIWSWSADANANAFVRKHDMQHVFCTWSLIWTSMHMPMHGPESMTSNMSFAGGARPGLQRICQRTHPL